MKILVTPTSFTKQKSSENRELLEQFATQIVYNPYNRPLTGGELIPLLQDVDGYIAGLDYVSAEVIAKAAPSLKVISRYGAGYDRIDIKACGRKGIIVTNTPGANAQSVAELAFGLMLAVARRIAVADRDTREGGWPRITGVELYRKKLGIVGLGAIGKGVAMRAKGFSMEILAYDPWIDKSFCMHNGIKISTFEQVMECSDFISLHLPLNKDTQHIINAEAISSMKNGAIIINTARGGLIDEQAVYKALKCGKIGGLGLDVFEVEPPGASPFFRLDNVVVTPHIGSSTQEARREMGKLAVQNLIDVLTGKECPYVVNREYLKEGKTHEHK